LVAVVVAFGLAALLHRQPRRDDPDDAPPRDETMIERFRRSGE
jgi:hypothetical protein